MRENIAIITVDCLRWDTTMMATTPTIQKYFKKYNVDWVKVHPHGTYTLPSHVALFQSGHLPFSDDPEAPVKFQKEGNYKLFRMRGVGHRPKSKFVVPHSDNLVKGFESLGYRTIGVGGVAWFDTTKRTTRIWRNYFQEFYWRSRYKETYPHSLDYQLKDCKKILEDQSKPIFFFLNIAATHPPFRNDYTFDGQIRALEYVDARLDVLLQMLPRPLTVLLWSDHGTVLEEEGPKGHAYYHPKVMEVPIAMWKM